MPNAAQPGSLEVVAASGIATNVRARAAKAAGGLLQAVEAAAALLVVLEILILSAGVISRYVFNAPLLWSDELARFLFIWLSMLGAVVALRRGEHMRLSVLVNRASPGLRRWLETTASLVVIGFLLAILMPSYTLVELQWVVTIPSLQISDSYRVAAIGVGAVLMSLVAITRLIEQSSLKEIAGAIAIGVLVAAGLWLLRPVLLEIGNFNLVVFFGVMLGIAVAVGVPIGFAFGGATFLYLAIMTRTPFIVELTRMDEGMSVLILLSVPLFVFLGALIEMTGIARALVAFMATLVGHVRGGLSYVLLGAMFLVSGISGAKAADMAAIAPGLLPEMRRRGSNPSELAALLAASGAMSETIPPSLVLILVSSATGVSIAALFTGGILPAAVCALALVIAAYLRSRDDGGSTMPRVPAKQVLRASLLALPGLLLPFAIRSAVVDGIATATEVSTVGILYSLIVGPLVYRQFDWRRVYPSLVATASLSGAILLILGTASGMAWALTQSGFSRQLVAAMTSVPGESYGFLAISIVGFAILGSVLEGAPAILVFGPLLFPVARAVGIHEIHYSMVVILAMGLGLFAPPFGIGYYYACAIAQVAPDDTVGRIWPYLGALLIALCLIAAVPWISTGFL
ncbi:MAG TPA: TRAP transporter large permease subunit [Stellaceae bacterium]|nr:TRAP transporter large permease subunit [Stellaceae bacterium]